MGRQVGRRVILHGGQDDARILARCACGGRMERAVGPLRAGGGQEALREAANPCSRDHQRCRRRRIRDHRVGVSPANVWVTRRRYAEIRLIVWAQEKGGRNMICANLGQSLVCCANNLEFFCRLLFRRQAAVLVGMPLHSFPLSKI
jgi:hypothetical protein